MTDSPYEGLRIDQWEQKTKELICEYPIPSQELVSAVLNSWDMIFQSKIGGVLTIGINYFPMPQILGDFLHELIPIELSKHDNRFRKGISPTTEKDIIYKDDDYYSIEIKTSSRPNEVYGNRSYAQDGSNSGKKKSGYFLVVNFPSVHTDECWSQITQIRFGWLDATDWQGQKSPTGQQARVRAETLRRKLLKLY